MKEKKATAEKRAIHEFALEIDFLESEPIIHLKTSSYTQDGESIVIELSTQDIHNLIKLAGCV